MSRRQKLGNLFVKNLSHDHSLLELADACFDAMTDEQKRQCRARMDL